MLVYDGDCGFCTRCAEWARRRLPAGVEVVANQAVDLAAVGLTPAEVAKAAWWVEPGGRRSGGHLGVAAVLRAIGGGWALLGVLLPVPPFRWVAALVYRLVARYRYRLPGSTDACRLPPG